MASRCNVLCWCVVLLALVGIRRVVRGTVHEGGGAGRRAEDQVWLKEILQQQEEFEYNWHKKPFDDLESGEQPRVLHCLPPLDDPQPLSYTLDSPPTPGATLVVAMDLKPLGRTSDREVTLPLILCKKTWPEGDWIAVQFTGTQALLSVRLGSWQLERRLGTARAWRSTRVFFAVLQNKVFWRRDDGSTRQALLPPSPTPEPRVYNFNVMFCGHKLLPMAFRGEISNMMINFKHVLFSKDGTRNLPPPATLHPYDYKQEYELSHAVLRCPRPLVASLHLRLRSLKNNLHRSKDCVLIYVPYAPPAAGQQQQHGAAAEAWSGWGLVLTAENRIVFCYDVIHRHGCESFQPPSLSYADLIGVSVELLRGVLHVEARTSVSKWSGVSLRQYAAPLPCPDALYLGHLPDHLPSTVRLRHQAFEGRLGWLTVNHDARLNPKTFTQRGPRRVSENLATYALPALSVRGGKALYMERRVTPGSATYAMCPRGVRGDWHDLTGRVLARDREVIKIVSSDSMEGEGVYVCSVPHDRLGGRVLTVTAVYYKAHAGGLAAGRRLRQEESLASVQRAFAASWLVVVALVVFLASVITAVERTRGAGRGLRTSVLGCLALFGGGYPSSGTTLASRDVRGFVYQIHALHQAVLARLTDKERGGMDPLRHMYKTGRSSVDIEKLFSTGRWEAAMQKPANAPSTSRYQPSFLASPLLHYPDDYRHVADTLMGRAPRKKKHAASPSPPPSTLSTPYNQ